MAMIETENDGFMEQVTKIHRFHSNGRMLIYSFVVSVELDVIF